MWPLLLFPATLALLIAADWLWSNGIERGEADERRRWEPRWCEEVARRKRELASGHDLIARLDALNTRHTRQRRRLRGVLGEARRWKRVAVSLGWRRRPGPPPVVPSPVVAQHTATTPTYAEECAITARWKTARMSAGGGI